MNTTLADQYYIKALDGYPYSLQEAIENLNYALSYNSEHAGANYLMGKLYHENFEDAEKAEFYYQIALAYDPANKNLCLDYVLLLITNKEFAKAQKLLNYSKKMKGLDLGQWFKLQALKFEYQHKYEKAIAFYQKAHCEAYSEEFINEVKSDLKRVKEKVKLVNKVSKPKTEEVKPITDNLIINDSIEKEASEK